jgi:AcrR family transcriptional regulator
VGRWEPGARERLRTAAIELFAERGYEETTVAEIAARAGLTQRTFFRYFADKREVLFDGTNELMTLLVDAVTNAPESMSPLDAIITALDAAAEAVFDPRRATVHRRQAIVAANPEPRERELLKLATMTAGLADALRTRGVPDPTAALIAETGMALFKTAFDRWTSEPNSLGLSAYIHQTLADLRATLLEADGPAGGAD